MQHLSLSLLHDGKFPIFFLHPSVFSMRKHLSLLLHLHPSHIATVLPIISLLLSRAALHNEKLHLHVVPSSPFVSSLSLSLSLFLSPHRSFVYFSVACVCVGVLEKFTSSLSLLVSFFCHLFSLPHSLSLSLSCARAKEGCVSSLISRLPLFLCLLPSSVSSPFLFQLLSLSHLLSSALSIMWT